MGENGAGKSTLLNILAGALRPNRGQVVRRGALGYCPQQVLLHDSLTVNQHLDYFRAAYGIPDLRYAGELRAQGCALLVISHLFFEQQRFDELYQLQHGQAMRTTITAALAKGGTT